MEDKNITVDKIVEICEGRLLSRGTVPTINAFCVDTRKINAEDMFVSLKSEKGGEIQHIKEALQKGAIGCITEKDVPEEIINKDRYSYRLLHRWQDFQGREAELQLPFPKSLRSSL